MQSGHCRNNNFHQLVTRNGLFCARNYPYLCWWIVIGKHDVSSDSLSLQRTDMLLQELSSEHSQRTRNPITFQHNKRFSHSRDDSEPTDRSQVKLLSPPTEWDLVLRTAQRTHTHAEIRRCAYACAWGWQQLQKLVLPEINHTISNLDNLGGGI